MKKQAESKTALIYCRKSTDKQDVTLKDQEERLKAYCTAKGLDVVEVISEEISAKIPLEKRGGGAKLLSALKQGQAGHVVAFKLDRLFRNAADCLNVTKDWDNRGIGFHILDINIDTSTPMGRMFLTCAAGFAEMERGLIAERTRNGLNYKKAHGEVYSNTPYGYDARGGKLIENPEEQKVLRRIKRLRTLKKSYQEIADALNSDGIPAKRGGEWQRGSVHYVLNNGLHG
jgi:site-specific DNA recombinase